MAKRGGSRTEKNKPRTSRRNRNAQATADCSSLNPMPQLNLKPTHKVIRNYYATLQQYGKHNITHEGAVSNPFAFLLDACAKQVDATLVSQYAMRTPAGNRIVIDGVILDAYGLPFAYWEAKVDKRGGIVNDPNRADQPRYIVDLIARVISVSLRTAEIVEDLSPFFLDN